MRNGILRLGLGLIGISLLALAWEVYEKTREGNQHWQEGKYQEALAKYIEAGIKAKPKEQALLHYNTGTTFYKQGRYKEATQELEQALSVSDLKLKEKVYYNLGNCYFRLGKEEKNLELLKKSAESYQKALEIDPNDKEAKHNLEVVRRHIRLQQEPPPPTAPSCQKKTEEKKKEGEESQKSQAEQKQAQAESAQEPKPTGQGQVAGELSKEQAERILKSLSEQEKEELKKMMRTNVIQAPEGKDW